MGKNLLAALFCILACALCAVGRAEPAPGVADLAWMAGHWIDGSGGDLSEETWVPPAGDCLSGMWRWVVGDKVKLYELLTITAETEGIVMRLRHFDRSGVGWEDKEHPLVLKLVRSQPGMAVFEGRGAKGFLRLTYQRVDADTLTGVLETGSSEKDARREDFRFHRQALP